MNALITNMATQRSHELREYASKRRLATGLRGAKRSARPAGDGHIAIRRLDPEYDGAELIRLAGRDSADTPQGEVLGAERDGRLVAAVSLQTGELIADPFTPTAQAREMLEQRAQQIDSGDPRHTVRRHGFHIRAAHPHRS